MLSPEMRQARVERLTDQLRAMVGRLFAGPDGLERAWDIAEQVVAAQARGLSGRVRLLPRSAVEELRAEHRLSRSATYRLLERWAVKDGGRYLLDDAARDAIQEEVAVRRARDVMLRLLMEGRLIKGHGPKSEGAARRWLQRHWRPERERLVRAPSRRYDVRDPAELEAAIEAIEAIDPNLVRRSGA